MSMTGGFGTPQYGFPSSVLFATQVIIVGSNNGLFVYNGSPSLGNPPILSISNSNVDPYGNVITPSLTLAGFPELIYSGAPGSTNLIAAISGMAGTDNYGNDYIAGAQFGADGTEQISLVPNANTPLALTNAINGIFAGIAQADSGDSSQQLGGIFGAAVLGAGIPAQFPSLVSTNGTSLQDASGYIFPPMRGINVQGQETGIVQADYDAMAAEGAQFVRLAIYWTDLEPTQGNISASYLNTIDKHIEYATNAGLYVWLNFFGEDANTFPTWLTPDPSTNKYSVINMLNGSPPNAQQAIVALSQRYGNSSGPLGANYTAVMGIGLNEPVADNTNVNSIATNITTQEATIFGWARSNGAPQWIVGFAMDGSSAAPIPNAATPVNSGQTTQTFVGMSTTPISGCNFLIEFHDNLKCFSSTNTSPDSRNTQFGWDNANNVISTGNAAADAIGYPPTTQPNEMDCVADQLAHAACYIDYAALANCPLFISERNWDMPIQKGGPSGVPDYGSIAYCNDKNNLYSTSPVVPAIESIWDYNRNQNTPPGADGYALRPDDADAIGVNPATGWTYYADTFFHTPPVSIAAKMSAVVSSPFGTQGTALLLTAENDGGTDTAWSMLCITSSPDSQTLVITPIAWFFPYGMVLYSGASGINIFSATEGSGTLPGLPATVKAEAWGSSGGGGVSTNFGGASAGAGEYAAELSLATSGSVTWAVGAPGVGGIPGGRASTPGAASTIVGSAKTVTANGGQNGISTNQPGAGGTGSTNTIAFDGGPGQTTVTNALGGAGGGSSAGPTQSGNQGALGGLEGTRNAAGGVAPPGGGAGGDGGTNGNVGFGGQVPGGGGGGGGAGAEAGDGASGMIRITWSTGAPAVLASIAANTITDPFGTMIPVGTQLPGNAWNQVTVDSGWTANPSLGPQYRLTPEGNLQLAGKATHAAMTTETALNSTHPIPTIYRPVSDKKFYQSNRAGGLTGAAVDTTGIIYAEPNGVSATIVDLTGIIDLL